MKSRGNIKLIAWTILRIGTRLITGDVQWNFIWFTSGRN